MLKTLAVVIMLLGVMGLALGGIFIWQGMAKNDLISDRMKVEQVKLAVDPNNPQQLTAITDAASAQKAADTIAGHRRAIAPSYQELLGTGRFDATNPQHLTYAQAMNLENYLYMAVTAFGLTQAVMGSGVYMAVVGLAVLLIGLAVFKLAQQTG